MISREELTKRAIALLAKRQHVDAPILLDARAATHPATGEPVHRVTIASKADPNGVQYSALVGSGGNLMESTRELEALFDPAKDTAVEGVPKLPASERASATIQPTENILT